MSYVDDELFETLAAMPAEPTEIPSVVNNHADQLQALIEACDDHANRLDSLESEEPGSILDRLSTLEQDFEREVEGRQDRVARLTLHDQAIQQLRTEIEALKGAKPAIQTQQTLYPELKELTVKLRALGGDWSTVQAYDLGDGRVLLNHMTPSREKIEAHVINQAKRNAAPPPVDYGPC